MRAQLIQAGLHSLVITVAALGFTQPAQADSSGAVDCLQTHLISSTKVIDNQTILFKTRGNQWYRNELPHKCSGLQSAGKFLYKTSTAQLCRVDVITVLQDAGGLMKGATCGLGPFVPTDDPSGKPKGK